MGSFPNCEIKLCDMESARVIQEDEHIREVIGTPDYVGEFIQLAGWCRSEWWATWSLDVPSFGTVCSVITFKSQYASYSGLIQEKRHGTSLH